MSGKDGSTEFAAFWLAFVEHFEAQEELDRSHIVEFDPRDEDDAIRARRQAREQRERALRRLFLASDALRMARGLFESFSRPPEPDAGYYVTAKLDGRVAVLAGPFPLHKQALRLVPAARDAAIQRDGRAAFALFGTSAISPPSQVGVLNGVLMVTP